MTSNFEYAVEMPPQSPEMEVFGGRYILKWHDRQIKMTVDRFLARNYKVEAEVTVEFLNRTEGKRIITKGLVNILPFLLRLFHISFNLFMFPPS